MQRRHCKELVPCFIIIFFFFIQREEKWKKKRKRKKINILLEQSRTEQSMKRREGDRVKREAAEDLICLCLAVCVASGFFLHPYSSLIHAWWCLQLQLVSQHKQSKPPYPLLATSAAKTDEELLVCNATTPVQ